MKLIIFLLLALVFQAAGQGFNIHTPFYAAAFLHGSTILSPASGMQYWFKADGVLWQNIEGTTAVTADGQAVGRWEDASSYSRHATNGVANRFPVYRANQINGKPAVQFAGGATNLAYINTGVVFDNATTNTIFIVATNDFPAYSSYAVITAGLDDLSPRCITAWYIVGGDQSFRLYTSADNGYFGSPTSSGVMIKYGVYRVVCNGATSDFYTNGVRATVAGFNAGTGQLKGFIIGNRYSVDLGMIGKVAEILVYNTPMSSTAITQTEDYLKSKYNLPMP